MSSGINYDYYIENTLHSRGREGQEIVRLQSSEFDFLFVEPINLGLECDVGHLDLQHVRDQLGPLCFEAC